MYLLPNALIIKVLFACEGWGHEFGERQRA